MKWRLFLFGGLCLASATMGAWTSVLAEGNDVQTFNQKNGQVNANFSGGQISVSETMIAGDSTTNQASISYSSGWTGPCCGSDWKLTEVTAWGSFAGDISVNPAVKSGSASGTLSGTLSEYTGWGGDWNSSTVDVYFDVELVATEQPSGTVNIDNDFDRETGWRRISRLIATSASAEGVVSLSYDDGGTVVDIVSEAPTSNWGTELRHIRNGRTTIVPN